jgi:tripartite-type tricarboxylate transporter receptor subunit TctC
MDRLLGCLAALLVAASVAVALAVPFAVPAALAQPASLRGKTITMIIGYPGGGGTDLSGRLIASVLGRYLPGEPTVVVQNVPGAEGMTAMNYFVQQVKPDGLTLTMGSGSQAEPTHYRKPQSQYDPTAFVFVGGAGRGGSALVVNRAAEPRLYAKETPPLVMGTTVGGFRSNMQMAAWGREFLDWNLKWVPGYRGTSDLFVALERGEIDMTATGNVGPIVKLLATGKYKVLAQAGSVKDGRHLARTEFGDAPLMPLLIAGRIKDPIAAKGFEYWETISSGPEKWLALPPHAPKPLAALYREAFARMVTDAEFIERSRKLADDFTPVPYGDVEAWIKAMANTPPEALDFIATMIRGQGLKMDP